MKIRKITKISFVAQDPSKHDNNDGIHRMTQNYDGNSQNIQILQLFFIKNWNLRACDFLRVNARKLSPPLFDEIFQWNIQRSGKICSRKQFACDQNRFKETKGDQENSLDPNFAMFLETVCSPLCEIRFPCFASVRVIRFFKELILSYCWNELGFSSFLILAWEVRETRSKLTAL